MIAKLKAVPPLAWLGLVLVAGLGVLAWHRYALDDQDTDWTGAKETPAPLMAALPLTPGQHGSGTPMSCNTGFRSRSYPVSLTASESSVIGEC